MIEAQIILQLLDFLQHFYSNNRVAVSIIHFYKAFNPTDMIMSSRLTAAIIDSSFSRGMSWMRNYLDICVRVSDCFNN